MRAQTVTQKNLLKLSEGRYRVSDSLYLLVRRDGKSRTWVFRYRIGRVRRDLSLGSATVVPLSLAKEEAKKCQILVAQGVDPKDVREARHVEKAKDYRLDEYAGTVFEEIVARRNVRPSTHQCYRYYLNAILIRLGRFRLSQITPQIIYEKFKKYYSHNPNRAISIIGLLRAIYAVAQRDGVINKNPAIWEDVLDQYFPFMKTENTVKHIYAASLDETKLLVRNCLIEGTSTSLCIPTIIFTASRQKEISTLDWECVDFETETISILPQFRKDRVNEIHRVPMPKQLCVILKHHLGNNKKEGPVFLGRLSKKRLAQLTVLAAAKRITKNKQVTMHGFRSTFRVWAAEEGVQFEVAEKCLMHKVGSMIYRSYQRSDLLELRREVMQKWADTLISVEEVEELLK